MTPTTMASSLDRSNTVNDNEKDRNVDAFLGALVALCGGPSISTPLSTLRARLTDMSTEEFDGVLALLDRDGAIVVDRGMDRTTVRLASREFAIPNVPQNLVDRVIGAIWSIGQAPFQPVSLAGLRARLNDLTQVHYERALTAALVSGQIELCRGCDGPAVRVCVTGRMSAAIGPFGRDRSHILDRGEALRAATRDVAHRLWVLRGCPTGCELRDWVDAERIVLEQAPLMSGSFVPGPFVPGPFAQGAFAQGAFAQGSFVSAPLGVSNGC